MRQEGVLACPPPCSRAPLPPVQFPTSHAPSSRAPLHLQGIKSPFHSAFFQALWDFPPAGQPQHRGALPAAGFLRLACAAARPLRPGPALLSPDPGGQLDPRAAAHARPAPAHTHVLLPVPPGTGGRGLHHEPGSRAACAVRSCGCSARAAWPSWATRWRWARSSACCWR